MTKPFDGIERADALAAVEKLRDEVAGEQEEHSDRQSLRYAYLSGRRDAYDKVLWLLRNEL